MKFPPDYFMSVSIPYRFNERNKLVFCAYRSQTFQFLIGSMKVSRSAGIGVFVAFQFLIGSMKARVV